MSEITKCSITLVELQEQPLGCSSKEWINNLLWNKGFYFILDDNGYPLLHKPVGVISCAKDTITGDRYYTQERPDKYEYN